jgi:hypothetical protein
MPEKNTKPAEGPKQNPPEPPKAGPESPKTEMDKVLSQGDSVGTGEASKGPDPVVEAMLKDFSTRLGSLENENAKLKSELAETKVEPVPVPVLKKTLVRLVHPDGNVVRVKEEDAAKLKKTYGFTEPKTKDDELNELKNQTMKAIQAL